MCAGQSKKSGRVRPETSLKSRVASRTPLSAARLASSSPGAWTRESPMIHRRTGSSGVGFLGTEVVVGASSGTFVVVGGGGSGGGAGGGWGGGGGGVGGGGGGGGEAAAGAGAGPAEQHPVAGGLHGLRDHDRDRPVPGVDRKRPGGTGQGGGVEEPGQREPRHHGDEHLTGGGR